MGSIGHVGGAARWSGPEEPEASPTHGAPRSTADEPAATGRGPAAGEAVAALPFGRSARVRALDGAGGVREPSGAAFHEGRGTLFVVGDRGAVVEMTRDGEILHKKKLDGLDLECVTVGPEGRLYAVDEGKPSKIVEIDPDTLKVLRKFKIDPDFRGKSEAAKRKNDGVEGIAWVPQERAFYVLNQDHPVRLLKLDVPLGKKDGGKAEITRAVDLGDDVKKQGSDLAWDARSGHFLVTESRGDSRKGGLVHEVTPRGRLVRSVPLPGLNTEGLALDGKGSAFITQDSGGIIRVDPG